MINLTAQLDADLATLSGKQLPYIASRAVNATAINSRDLVRDNLPKRFRLRNQWTKRGIQTRTGNKSSLSATVVAPDYMAIQETGGTRLPENSKYLAAPGKALQTGRVIPKGKRPRALADKAFFIDMPGGEKGVFIRHGRKRGQIRLLWWLDDQQQYDDRFMFERDVNDYVQDRFSSHFLNEWVKVMGDGGYAKSASKGRKRIDRPEGMSLRAYRRSQGK